jgi:hypothetical protein
MSNANDTVAEIAAQCGDPLTILMLWAKADISPASTDTLCQSLIESDGESGLHILAAFGLCQPTPTQRKKLLQALKQRGRTSEALETAQVLGYVA